MASLGENGFDGWEEVGVPMNHGVGEQVIELNNEVAKYSADVHLQLDELTEKFQRTQNEFQAVQAAQNQQIQHLEETLIQNLQELKTLYQDLQQKFETDMRELAAQRVTAPAAMGLETGQLPAIPVDFEAHVVALRNLEQQVREFSQFSPEKLREELITGIRLLGERVSKAIQEMNDRFENFSREFQSQRNTETQLPVVLESPNPADESKSFAELKEVELTDVTDCEIVPRDAIKKLTDLFKKQSLAIKNFIDKHESQLSSFENLLKTYDEENARLLELLDKRVKRNFRISIGAILMLILYAVISRLI